MAVAGTATRCQPGRDAVASSSVIRERRCRVPCSAPSPTATGQVNDSRERGHSPIADHCRFQTAPCTHGPLSP
jgi:hypothetical protein